MLNPVRSWQCVVGFPVTLGIALNGADVQASETATEDAAQAPVESVALDLYSPPWSKERANPVYPVQLLGEGKEGWVRLDFMVDPKGKPYEIAVSESMGDWRFEGAAVRALEKSTFEAARVDGEPADAGHSMQYVFILQGGPKGAGEWFVRAHRAVMRAIGEGDREKAEKRLASLEFHTRLSLYEDAYLHVAKFNYYAKWGDKHQQLRALDRAVAHEFAEKHLPQELFTNCQRVRFKLLVETHDYERAIHTYYLLRGLELEEPVLAALERVVERLESLRADGRAYAVPGDFGDRASWSYNLFKDEFLIQDVEGHIAEIKLRCRTDFVFFRFEPGIKYRVADKDNRCHLQLVGNPGTTFTLTQM